MKISVTASKGAIILEVGHEQALKVSAANLTANPSTETMFTASVNEYLATLLGEVKKRTNGARA